MSARSKLILFTPIALSLCVGHLTRAQDLPSTEEVLKRVKQNLCAPTIDPSKKKGSKSQLEASACTDCANTSVAQSTGLGDTADQVRALFAPLKAEEDKALIKRDLAFFRSTYGQTLVASYSAYNLTTGQKLKNAQEKLESFVNSKNEVVEGKKKLNETIAALENAATGKELSAAEKLIIDEQLETEIQKREEKIEAMTAFLGIMKMAATSSPSDSKSKAVENYENDLKNVVQESDLYKKALAGSKDKDVLEVFSNLLGSSKKNPANFASLVHFDKLISEHEKEVETLKKKLDEENQKAAKPKSQDVPLTENDELAKSEEKVLSILRNMSQGDGFKACGMTVAEAAMIRFYTGFGFREMNKALRLGGKPAEEAKIAAEVLNAALKKLSRYTGTVKRGTTLPKDKLNEYQVGKIISFPAYTSTSLSNGWGGNAKFVIHTKTGRYVGAHSAHPSEDEVLIAPGTKFKVIDRKETNVDVEFVLDEIDPRIRPKAKGDSQ